MSRVRAIESRTSDTRLELDDVEERELAHHEQVYAERRVNVDWVLNPQTFLQDLDRQDVVSRYDINRLALDVLGGVAGKTILDYGCGDGRFGVWFARLGARQVKGFDLSAKAIDLARERARRNGVAEIAEFQQMSAHALEYADETFDLVFGNLIMHHIPVERLEDCGRQVHRVLKQNGKAVFVEPLGENPLLEFIRTHPFYDKWYASPDERTLKYRDIYAFGNHFRRVRCYERHLLFMAKRVVRNPRILGALKTIDAALLRVAPPLKRFCGEVVVEYSREDEK